MVTLGLRGKWVRLAVIRDLFYQRHRAKVESPGVRMSQLNQLVYRMTSREDDNMQFYFSG